VVATRDEQEVTTASESILARAAEDIEKKEARGMRLTNISRSQLQKYFVQTSRRSSLSFRESFILFPFSRETTTRDQRIPFRLKFEAALGFFS